MERVADWLDERADKLEESATVREVAKRFGLNFSDVRKRMNLQRGEKV